jgi:ubiquinone/menaquinone biosynthesis C-methylase UbiE
MSVYTQNMIAALEPLRTPPAVFAGYRPELKNIKPSQWVTWKLGDTSDAGTTFRVANERLCESLGLQTGERVLNVTAGNGSMTLAADEKLPFRSSAFDVVLSGFGAMFAPGHSQIACELLRVCRPGGRIGLASWTPESFNGRLISIIARHSTSRGELNSPAQWGARVYLNGLFGESADALGAATHIHTWRYRSPQHWLDLWRSHGGPLQKAFSAVDPDRDEQFSSELLALVDRFNMANDGSMVVPVEYLAFLVYKSAR